MGEARLNLKTCGWGGAGFIVNRGGGWGGGAMMQEEEGKGGEHVVEGVTIMKGG